MGDALNLGCFVTSYEIRHVDSISFRLYTISQMQLSICSYEQ